MSECSVFVQVGQRLREFLCEALVPAVFSTPDMVRLAYPGQEEEFRLGVYLYDMEEVRPNGPPGMTRLSADSRRLPDLALAVYGMAFANRRAAFSGMETTDELLLLEAVLRAVHSVSSLEMDGSSLRIGFQALSRPDKVALWQSLGAPLQPAVYFVLEPVPVPSSRIRRVPPVREVEIGTRALDRPGQTGQEGGV